MYNEDFCELMAKQIQIFKPPADRQTNANQLYFPGGHLA